MWPNDSVQYFKYLQNARVSSFHPITSQKFIRRRWRLCFVNSPLGLLSTVCAGGGAVVGVAGVCVAGAGVYWNRTRPDRKAPGDAAPPRQIDIVWTPSAGPGHYC